nr:MAG TPA: hypothetical protein [Caudoviricetes sp.]
MSITYIFNFFQHSYKNKLNKIIIVCEFEICFKKFS